MKELSLPPVKIHCSVLAEDAIKAAITDWKKKHDKKDNVTMAIEITDNAVDEVRRMMAKGRRQRRRTCASA